MVVRASPGEIGDADDPAHGAGLLGVPLGAQIGTLRAPPSVPIAGRASPVVERRDISGLDITVIEAAWALLILAAPALCFLCGRAIGLGGARALLAVFASIVLAAAAVGQRGDEPLHANGHGWREAREVLAPVGVRTDGLAPFLHGKGGISLAWLLADVERMLTGSANPFRISRVASAGAAGGAALLAIVLARSAGAGLAAGGVVGLMPLARTIAVSGSALAIPAWMLPWSLALLLAAASSGSRVLLAGAVLGAAVGTLSHTAMLAWPAALVVAWALAARRDIRASADAIAALLVVAIAWLVQLDTCWDMLAERNEGSGLLANAVHGFEAANLFVDSSWVSPLLAPLVLLWVVLNLRRERWRLMAASVLPAALAAVPFFAVTACSSDAVRYQGALVGLATSLAVAGLWRTPLPTSIDGAGAATLRAGVVLLLVAFPLPSMRQPIDPAVVEHRLVVEAAPQIQPGTLVILPTGRYASGTILTEFPDFVLPERSQVVLQDDARIREYRGPRLLYLGLACISWDRNERDAPSGEHPTGMRPECRALRGEAHPWRVRSLTAADIPRGADGRPWTFHVLSVDEPFGFFEP